LTTRLAGLIDTVNDSGILLNGPNSSPEYQERFIQESIKLLTDKNYWNEWSEKSYRNATKYTWEYSANLWKELFELKNIKLNLGSGNNKKEGFKSCDCFKADFIDEVFDISKIPYPDNSVDELFSQHAIEHLTFTNVELALRDWYRVLKPGGKLTLRLPDFKLCCLNYLASENATDSMWYRNTIFGIQVSQIGEPDDAQIHRSGFSKNEMEILLKSIGYIIDKSFHYDGYRTPSQHIECHK
jgi:SAM-dependent methyltransferase